MCGSTATHHSSVVKHSFLTGVITMPLMRSRMLKLFCLAGVCGWVVGGLLSTRRAIADETRVGQVCGGVYCNAVMITNHPECFNTANCVGQGSSDNDPIDTCYNQAGGSCSTIEVISNSCIGKCDTRLEVACTLVLPDCIQMADPKTGLQ